MTASKESELSSRQLSRAAASGALWNGVATAGVQGLGFVSYVVVAWYLGPQEFGSAAMAMAIVSFARMLGGVGLAPAIVSGRLTGELETISAHWLVAAVGLSMAGLMAAAAPAVAHFFQNPQVTLLLVVAASLPAIDAFAVVPQSLLQSQNRFDRLAMIETVAQLFAGMAAIAMAATGFGVWALVLPQVSGRLARAGWICAIAPLRYAARFSLASLRPHLAESSHVLGAATSDYVFKNADKIVIGRFFGTIELGFYQFAHNCFSRVLTTLTQTVALPLMASLSRLRDDLERFDRAVVRALCTVARISFPITLGGALVAPLLVEVLLGDRWSETIVLFRWFLPLAAVQSVGGLAGAVWLALGHSRLLLHWGVVTSASTVLVFLFGVWLGSIEAVAASFALYSSCVLGPATVLVTRRVCRLPLTGLASGLGTVLLDVAVMLGVVALLGNLLSGLEIPAVPKLAAQVLTGAVSYLTILRFVHAKELAELIELMPSGLRGLLRPLSAQRPGLSAAEPEPR